MDQIPIDINRLTAVISNRRKILSSKVMCQHQYEQNQLKAQELEDGEDIKNNDEEKKLPNTDIIQCQWTGQLNKLHEHLTLNCILRSVICPYQKYGCHVDNLNPKTLETHLSDPNMILAHLTLITDAYQVLENKYNILEEENKKLIKQQNNDQKDEKQNENKIEEKKYNDNKINNNELQYNNKKILIMNYKIIN